MAREWTSNGLGGASREFLCASARVSPEFGLLCAQVACVVFLDLAYSLQKAPYRRLETNGTHNSSSFQAL
jgi:hypothetical protein